MSRAYVCFRRTSLVHSPGGSSRRRVLTPRHRAPRLTPGDVAPELTDLVNIVNAIGRLWVLFLDIQIEMAAEGGGREGLVTERASLILHGSIFGLLC